MAALVAGAAAVAAATAGALALMGKKSPSPPPSPQALASSVGPESRLRASQLPEYSSPDDYSAIADTSVAYAAPGGLSKTVVRGAPVRDGNGEIPRVGDKERYDHPDLGSPGYQDQRWAWDCGQFNTCAASPFASGSKPPLEGEHMSRPTENLGDFLPGLQTETGRDAETEFMNEEPTPTRRYADYALGNGEPLESWHIPHGATPATDVEFWGPRDWDAERKNLLPSYVSNGTAELNGKEINRPDTYFSDWGPEPFADGSAPVEFSGGMASGRTTDVRLLSRNRYGSFVTTKDPRDEKKFLPPTITRSGNGMPNLGPERHLGARIITAFNAFWPWRGKGNSAPSEMAEVRLPMHMHNPTVYEARVGDAGARAPSYGDEGTSNVHQGGRESRLLNFDYWQRAGNLPPGGAAPAGPETNPVQGGVMRRIVGPGVRTDVGGADAGQYGRVVAPRFEVGANSGTEHNPPEGGYHYTSRVRINGHETFLGRGFHGGSGPIQLFNFLAGDHGKKDNSGRADYQAPGGYVGSAYAGDKASGVFLPHAARISWPFAIGGRTGGGGNGGKVGVRDSAWTVSGNMAIGTKGCDWDGQPDADIGDAFKNPLAASILGRRTEQELDDIESVAHS